MGIRDDNKIWFNNNFDSLFVSPESTVSSQDREVMENLSELPEVASILASDSYEPTIFDYFTHYDFQFYFDELSAYTNPIERFTRCMTMFTLDLGSTKTINMKFYKRAVVFTSVVRHAPNVITNSENSAFYKNLLLNQHNYFNDLSDLTSFPFEMNEGSFQSDREIILEHFNAMNEEPEKLLACKDLLFQIIDLCTLDESILQQHCTEESLYGKLTLSMLAMPSSIKGELSSLISRYMAWIEAVESIQS